MRGEGDAAASGESSTSVRDSSRVQGSAGFATAPRSAVLRPTTPLCGQRCTEFRLLSKRGRLWFGGGLDLTPSYHLPFDDANPTFQHLKGRPCDGIKPQASNIPARCSKALADRCDAK